MTLIWLFPVAPVAKKVSVHSKIFGSELVESPLSNFDLRKVVTNSLAFVSCILYLYRSHNCPPEVQNRLQ